MLLAKTRWIAPYFLLNALKWTNAILMNRDFQTIVFTTKAFGLWKTRIYRPSSWINKWKKRLRNEQREPITIERAHLYLHRIAISFFFFFFLLLSLFLFLSFYLTLFFFIIIFFFNFLWGFFLFLVVAEYCGIDSNQSRDDVSWRLWFGWHESAGISFEKGQDNR